MINRMANASTAENLKHKHTYSDVQRTSCKTPQKIRHITEQMKEGIDAWLSDRPNRRPHKTQDTIGWESFLYGYIAADWRHQQSKYTHKQQTNKQTGYTWTMKIIQFIWQQTNLIWTQRNKDTHDKTSAQAKAHELRNIKIRLRVVYLLRDGVRHYDKRIFDTNIDEMMLRHPKQLIKWLNVYEPYMRHRYRITVSNIAKQQRHITDFFTVSEPNMNPN